MSITFSPDIKRGMSNEDNLVWEANFVQHCDFDDIPKEIKEFIETKNDYLDYYLYDLGAQPLSYWEEFLKPFNLVIYADHPTKKIYVDKLKNYKIAIVLTGFNMQDAKMELTLSNVNAKTLLQLLQLPLVDSGRISPHQLMHAISSVDATIPKLKEFTTPPTDEQYNDPDAPLGLGQGARMIDIGLSLQSLIDYLGRLDQLCHYCIAHKCDIVWS